MKPEKKPPTKPWNAEDNPFVPDIFKLKTKRKGFRVRWADPSRVERWEREGWVIADASNYGGKRPGAIDSTVRTKSKEGMILMELPEEMARQKEKYLENVTAIRSASHIKQMKKDIKVIERSLGGSVSLKDEVEEKDEVRDEEELNDKEESVI